MLKRNIGAIVVAVPILTLLGATCYANFVRSRVLSGDFSAIRHASRHAIETGTLADVESLGYYPPSARPLLILLALPPVTWGAPCWWVLSVVCHFLSLYLIVSCCLPKAPNRRWWLAGLTYLALTPWVVSDLSSGNISPLVFVACVLSFSFYRCKRTVPAALALAVGMTVKLMPVLLLAYYAVRKQWRLVTIGLVLAVVIGTIPGMLIFGPGDFVTSWHIWADQIVKTRTPHYTIVEGPARSYAHQSWPNVFLRLLHPVNAGRAQQPFTVNVVNLSRPTILKLYYVFIAASLLLWFYMIWPKRSDPDSLDGVHFGMVCLAMVYFSPHVLTYYLVFAMPAVAMLIAAVAEPTRGAAANRIVVTVLLGLYVVGCASVASALARAVGAYQVIIVILFVALVYIRRTERSRFSVFEHTEA